MYNSEESNLLTTIQAAKYLSVSPKTLEKYRLEGGGPTFVKIGRCVRYRKKDLEDFIDSNVHTCTSEFSHLS